MPADDDQLESRRVDEQRFRLLVDSVEDYAIFLLDASGTVASWNAGAERIKGYQAHEIIGRHFSAFYPASDVAAGKCERELETAARVGRIEDEDWRIRKDGSRFWANVVITALRGAGGELVGFGKVTRDLTERKQAEEERRVVDARLGLLIDSVQDYAIFMLDPDGNVASWNAGAQRIKGYTADEIVGCHFSRFYPEADVRAGTCERELAEAAAEGRFEDEGWRLRKDGTKLWANVVISAVRDDLGKLIGFAKVTRDLTARKQTEEERAARLAAEQSNRTKDEFLAMLGHELRNPLAPIVSALQLLKLRGDPGSVREHQIIERQVRQMIRLVDDLLDVSRISRGKIELKRGVIDLRDALARAAEIAIPLFERKAQAFEIDVPPDAVVVDGDDARLVQVFANLLNNAAKYTPIGGAITLSVRRAGDDVAIEVKDNGNGMEPALLARVFDLFVQGYQDADRAEGGLGIGLSLVRSLVELHGGRVEARSDGRGRGSCFTVQLPASRAVQPTAPTADARLARAYGGVVTARCRILIVDDNDDARSLLADLLGALGHEVRTANDGVTALEVLAGFTPEVAILDIGLPGMDGYQLAERIRETPGGTRIRLLALSGYSQASDQARTQALGFAAHLVKPVDMRRLLDQLVVGRS